MVDIFDKIKVAIISTLVAPYVLKLAWMLVSAAVGGFCAFFEPGSFKAGYDAWMSIGMGYLGFLDSIPWIL